MYVVYTLKETIRYSTFCDLQINQINEPAIHSKLVYYADETMLNFEGNFQE